MLIAASLQCWRAFMVMLMCVDHVDLHDAQSDGLFNSVDSLSSGGVALKLKGRFWCPSVERAFYLFNVVDARNGEWLGKISFIPESDKAVIASIGNVGGEFPEENRGKGYFGKALSALAPLAHLHKLSEFMLVIPEGNAPLIGAAEKLGATRINSHKGLARFTVSV
jgi:RimJ/RimL family protein N-acetyltransferase